MQSSFGGMLGMFGGEAALEPLKRTICKKLQASIITITTSDSFQEILADALKSEDLSTDVHEKIKQDCKFKT